jgi:transposase InsO family protein
MAGCQTRRLKLIRRVLRTSPFAGQGYRKVGARLRREHGIRVSGKRVLRLLRQEGLLAPQRVRGRRRPHPHDGTIIPDGPNQRWGTDATMAWTRADGWVWVFACVDQGMCLTGRLNWSSRAQPIRTRPSRVARLRLGEDRRACSAPGVRRGGTHVPAVAGC